MTTTPNPTAESVIAEAMVNAGAPLMHSRVEESVAAALRANNLLSEGAPTEALIAEAKRRARKRRGEGWLKEADMLDRLIAALTAAGVAPQPVIDEAALAEVIADAPHSGDPNVSCLDPRCKAAAVAAWLREGVAPQEPSQTETKSGNNFVSLDPEKVAELIEQLRDRSRKERDVAKESLGHFIARALCEAYTEGKLT